MMDSLRFVVSCFRRVTALGVLLPAVFSLSAQLEVNSTLTPDQYVNDVLLGTGVEATNVQFTGSPTQIGQITGFDVTEFPIEAGLILSTEVANNPANIDEGCIEDFIDDGLEVSGDADLLNIANSVPPLIGQAFSVTSVNDICAIEFDFVATGDTVRFNYVFGSDEYLGWVNSQYNDIFGFFLSGPGINGPYADNAVNLAEVPGSDPQLAITISSVNDVTNAAYYIDNPGNDVLCQNGYTAKLTAESEVECGETYHIRLAIADGSDTALESFVILESGSFESNSVVEVDLNINVGADLETDNPVIFEDCGEAMLTFTRPIETIIDIEEMVIIDYSSSTATNGVDFTLLPDTVFFPPFVTVQQFPLDAFEDGIAEGSETVIMEILNLAACNGGGLTSYFEFDIIDEPDPLVVDGFDTELCVGDSVSLTPEVTGGYGNYAFSWDCNPGLDTNTINYIPDAAGVFECMVTVSDTCGMPSDDGLFEITVEEYPELTAEILGGDVVLSCNGFQEVFAVADGGNPPYTYSWELQDGLPAFGYGNSLFLSTWLNASEVHVIVEDACGLTAEAMVNVSIDVPELIVELDDNYEVSCNVPFTITPDWSGGEPYYNFAWLEGFSFLGFNQNLNWTTDSDMSITLEVSDGCGQFVTVETEVTVVSPALDVSLPDTLVGPCTESFNLVPVVDGGSGVYTYQWSQNFNPVADTETLTYSEGLSTSFTVEVTDNCQSTGSASTAIDIQNPALLVDLQDTINASCVDNTVVAVDILSGAGGYTYEWTIGGVPYGGSDPQITVQSFVTTPIAVEVLDGCGGADETSALLIIPDVPMTLSVSNDTVVCRGEALSLSAMATGGEGGFVYSWTSIPAFGENQYVAPSNSYSYPVEVTDICGETLSETVEVEVQYIYSDFYTSYLSDTRIEFIATPEPPCPNCDYDWDFGDGASSEEMSPTHEYDGLGDYYAQLTITNPLGCRDSAYTLVEGPVMVYIPNAFTPNNDGINDGFQVVISDVVYFEINIFNKWGEEIFYSTDPDEVWTGNVKGGDHYAPNGLYNYRLRWKGSRTDAEEFSGTIELMR
ncbi:choice-of-anchor L domain-containing protein [Flavobacteriales bacterium]|nr:choice-of-anchor L domain-containing protein [Flavobacteriales bacterium]MDA9001858.1 choice-of-anchor L domain-containing protein [bacterium]MDA9863444.1 choice-of-anchor L domain-containing protein [Flavobacteriales bacterium]